MKSIKFLCILLCLALLFVGVLGQPDAKDDKYAKDENGVDNEDPSFLALGVLLGIIYGVYVTFCAFITLIIYYPTISSLIGLVCCSSVFIGYYYYNSFRWEMLKKPIKLLKKSETGTKKFTGYFLQRDSSNPKILKKVKTECFITFKTNGEITGSGTDKIEGCSKNLNYKINGTIHNDDENVILIYTKNYNDVSITSTPYHIIFFTKFSNTDTMSGGGEYILFDFINPCNFVFRQEVNLISEIIY
tara:strand:- start:194 stop:928 length:735 start_codon:yes stop_codon:yes gene_type:complete